MWRGGGRLILSKMDEALKQRVLNFFNRVTRSAEIVNRIKDDPDFGMRRGYGIRRSLATRILEIRNNLPGKRFNSIEQINDVRGVGPDTLHDILYSFQYSGGLAMVKIYSIERYSYMLHSGLSAAVRITLIGKPQVEDNWIDPLAHVYFRREEESGTLSKPTSSMSGEPPYTFYFWMSACPVLIDMLRNEKPVNLFWYESGRAFIGTNQEPIGEEELG